MFGRGRWPRRIPISRWIIDMDSFGVPCPQCGSVKVVVGGQADRPTGPAGNDGKAHVPRLHRCDCQDCRHAFHHDFAFGR